MSEKYVYVGKYKKNIKKGVVKVTYPEGHVYEGDWEDDAANGHGKAKYASGEEYEGEWSNGMQEGEGTMVYTEGSNYEGYWSRNKREGEGIMTFSNGNVYYGEWSDDMHEGKGEMKYANGDVYDGEWSNNRREGEEGEGTMTYANGDVYEGQWINDIRVGGTLTYADGSWYEGGFEGGRSGYGELHNANGNYYEGNFSNDMINGYGTLEFDNGDRYVGNFYNNLMHGQGTITYADGDVYVGQWMNDQRNGLGTLRFANGEPSQNGHWTNDEFDNPQPANLPPPPPIARAPGHRAVRADQRVNIAYEIHRRSAKIDLEKLMKIIGYYTKFKFQTDSVDDYVKRMFYPYIQAEDKQRKLNEIMEQLTLAKDIFDRLDVKKVIVNCIHFVFNQKLIDGSPDTIFINAFIDAFIQDCYYAYETETTEEAERGDGISCSNGVYERFYIGIESAVMAVCPGGECGNPKYIELLEFFGKKPPDLNILIQKWSKEFLENEDKKHIFDGKDKDFVKQHFINYVQEKLREDDMLDDHTTELIKKKADELDVMDGHNVFKELHFGGSIFGGKQKTRKIRKIRKIKRTRKSTKRNKKKTIKRKTCRK